VGVRNNSVPPPRWPRRRGSRRRGAPARRGPFGAALGRRKRPTYAGCKRAVPAAAGGSRAGHCRGAGWSSSRAPRPRRGAAVGRSAPAGHGGTAAV
jgi:hypothetical protein